jgi:ubiquinone/menaquinone biosynthesis C-methylase UbiE
VLKREAIAEATVSIGRANDLRLFSDNSLDVVLTDAALMYVGPDKISHVISELTRVARKGLILNEWHLFQTDKGEPSSYWYYAHWVHNYTRLLGCAPRVKSFRIERLPAGLWNTGGGWEAFGAVIEVQL